MRPGGSQAFSYFCYADFPDIGQSLSRSSTLFREIVFVGPAVTAGDTSSRKPAAWSPVGGNRSALPWRSMAFSMKAKAANCRGVW